MQAEAPRVGVRHGVGHLYWRLLLWFCLANVVTLVVSIGITRQLERQFSARQADWQALAARAADLYTETDGRPGEAFNAWRKQLRERQIAVGLIDADGQVRAWPPRSVIEQRQALSEHPFVVLHPRPGITQAGVAVTGPDGRLWHFVGIQYPPRGGVFRWLAVGIEILVSLLVIGIVGGWVARSIGHPVGQVQDAARRFARGELGARVGPPLVERNSELGQLGRDFDDMAERIQSLLERQRGVLQDVSHELRSPLTRLGLTLELARADAGAKAQPALDRAEREIGRLDRAIGEVLELSRMEVQLPGANRERLDFARLVAERTRDMVDREGIRDSRWSRVLEDGLVVMGNPVLLGRAIDNLLGNAVKYSAAESVVDIRASRADGRIWLEIADHGPGVPAAELASLFRPFYRGTNAARAAGSGLGLAIVARIVAAHNGTCAARNREGGGLCVRVELPAA